MDILTPNDRKTETEVPRVKLYKKKQRRQEYREKNHKTEESGMKTGCANLGKRPCKTMYYVLGYNFGNCRFVINEIHQ